MRSVYHKTSDLSSVFNVLRGFQQALYKLFSDINATNNAIISQLRRGLENIKIHYPNTINPARKNVLDKRSVYAISGGTNYFPFAPENKEIEDISIQLANFKESTEYYQVSLKMFLDIFKHIISENDFTVSSFQGIIEATLADAPASQGILIVRRERDIKRGTGALLSPNDWNLGGRFTDKCVLTMYQVTGDKGWNGRKIWIPNIKLPNDILYYGVTDDASA